MDPATMALFATLIGGGLSGLGGSEGEFKSSFNENQLNSLDDILNSIRGMKGNQDITQNQGYQQGQNWLSNLFNDQSFFNAIEGPARRDFEENTIPSLANRFASQGSGGSLNSTGFRNQLAREGSNLHSNLAAMRTGLQQQGVNQQLGYAQQPFSNYQSLLGTALQPTQNVYQGPSAGFFGPIAGAFAGGAAQGYGQKLGGQFAGQYPGTM